jgi:5-methyltetrahydrofolate--homocysteine methyltransferase
MGSVDHLDEDIEKARQKLGRPQMFIDGALMDGMRVVRYPFKAAKIFLPHFLKSARAMKKAVAYLTPFMEAEKAEADDPAPLPSSMTRKSLPRLLTRWVMSPAN